MKTIETVVYNFDELSDSAKETARAWFRYNCLYEYGWWESTYEDAERAHLKLDSFDLDRNRHATGKFLLGAEDTAKAIITDHGKDCETYKTASTYLSNLEALLTKYKDKEDDLQFDYDKEDLDDSFLKEILQDYAIILQKESEYMYSEEYVDDNITANEYTFTESGERFG